MPKKRQTNVKAGRLSYECQCSSGVEQRFRKPPVVGSNPTAGSEVNMSKFVDKLQRLSKSSAPSIGFHPAASESKSLAMLLIAELSGGDIKEAKVIADGKADAGLILHQGFIAEKVKQMVKALGDVPLGVLLEGASKEEAGGLVGSGCDFVVFGVKIPAVAMLDEKVGKFLLIEPSLDQGLVRAINGLDIDGVFINKGKESFITVEHLLICRRFSELLDKPLVITLPSLVTGAELDNLWEAGVDGIVIPPGQPTKALAELRRMIDNLPRGIKRYRGKAGVILPRYGGDVVIEEDEEEERI